MHQLLDVSEGHWLIDRLDTSMAALGSWVPHGFDALVRVFPPFAVQADGDEPGEEHSMSWAETAERFGTVMHPAAQAQSLLGLSPHSNQTPLDGRGWQFEPPEEGRMPPPTLATLTRLLTEHTSTPDDATAAVWNGFGELTPASNIWLMKRTPWWRRLFAPRGESRVSRRTLRSESSWSSAADSGDSDGVRSVGAPATEASLADVPHPDLTAHAAQQELINGLDASALLELPAREHLLFACSVHEFKAEGWPRRAPWVDDDAPGEPLTPSILWPADRAWVVVQDVDIDTVIIACSETAAEDLCADPMLEAARIGYDTDLTANGDTINS